MDIDHKPGCSAIAILIVFVGILLNLLNLEFGVLCIYGGGGLLILSLKYDYEENKKDSDHDDENKKDSDPENLYNYKFCILVLLARVMNADGENMKCELDVVKSAIREYYVTGKEQEAALKQFQSILNDIDKYKKYNLSEICSSINKNSDTTAKLKNLSSGICWLWHMPTAICKKEGRSMKKTKYKLSPIIIWESYLMITKIF